jgi:hypothetical protein
MNEERFRDCYQLADRLIDAAEKETLAEVARILAIHVTHYESNYGKVTQTQLDAVEITLTTNKSSQGADYLAPRATGLVCDSKPRMCAS